MGLFVFDGLENIPPRVDNVSLRLHSREFPECGNIIEFVESRSQSLTTFSIYNQNQLGVYCTYNRTGLSLIQTRLNTPDKE